MRTAPMPMPAKKNTPYSTTRLACTWNGPTLNQRTAPKSNSIGT